MKKNLKLLILGIALTNITIAQEKATADLKLEMFLTVPTHNDLSQKFKFGAGGDLGVAIFIPQAKTYIIPHMGFDFTPGRSVGNDDTYRETAFFTDLGLEGMYQLVEVDNYQLLPFIGISSRKVIDRYLVANGNIIISNNGHDLEYDKLPPLFSASSVAVNIGLENRFAYNWFIRLTYQIYKPEVNANLNNSYDNIDNLIFNPTTQKLNLSMFKIGFGVYLW